jgi:DNA-binding transcriptional regulator YiaG
MSLEVHMSALSEEVRLARQLPPPLLAREIRRAAGVSRQRLADELGAHVVTVARWERGTRSPRAGVRVRYAAILAELREVVGA